MSSEPPKIPAGLELAFSLEKSNVRSSFDAFILSLHWSIVRTGLLIRNDQGENTERLPGGWSGRQQQPSSSNRTVNLTYHDPHDRRVHYQLKVIELTKDDMVAVTFYRSQSDNLSQSPEPDAKAPNRPASSAVSGTTEKNSAAATFQIGNFLRRQAFDGSTMDRKRATDVYEHADALEKQFYESVMEPLGLRVMGQPPVQGPYDDVRKDDDRRDRDNGTTSNNIHIERNPLMIDDRAFAPPAATRYFTPMGPGLLGQSDLDPLGRIGRGNVFDPRGRIGIPFPGAEPGGIAPGTIVPGARFDPFGPVNPNPTLPPQQRPDQGQGPGTFANPNPDHERPNIDDYDDMFM